MSEKKGSVAEVQRLSGVSASTISRVLRGAPRISEETRRKVLQAVQDSGYKPNQRLQTHFKRVHSKRYSIQYLIKKSNSDRRNELFFHRMLWPLEKEMADRQGSLVVSSLEESITGDNSTYAVVEGFVNGVVTGCSDEAILRRLCEFAPVVLFNSENRKVPVDCVIPDIERSIFEQLRYLAELGHRHIACYQALKSPSPANKWQTARIWSAFQQFYDDCGWSLPENYLEPILITPETNQEAARSYIARVFGNAKTAPTAIITSDIYVAFLLRELEGRGLRVPQDVSLIGYDDDLLERGCPIELSSYRQDFPHMAKVAIEILFGRLNGDKSSAKVVEIAGSLIHRDSVAPPSAKKRNRAEL